MSALAGAVEPAGETAGFGLVAFDAVADRHNGLLALGDPSSAQLYCVGVLCDLLLVAGGAVVAVDAFEVALVAALAVVSEQNGLAERDAVQSAACGFAGGCGSLFGGGSAAGEEVRAGCRPGASEVVSLGRAAPRRV